MNLELLGVARGFLAYHAVPPISAPFRRSGTTSSNSGAAPCSGEARKIERRGQTWTGWRIAGCPNPGYPILGYLSAIASNTQGGSRMREFCPYGSVQGAPGNGRPYRDLCQAAPDARLGPVIPGRVRMRGPPRRTLTANRVWRSAGVGADRFPSRPG